jgi:ABC-type Na+ efflux pump permease subunit
MQKHAARNDEHKLIHVLTGALAGIGVGLLAGFLGLQIFLDIFNFLIGPFYVGNATAFLSMLASVLLAIKVGLVCSSVMTNLLREVGTVISWFFFIGLLIFTVLVFRGGYMIGLLPTHW